MSPQPTGSLLPGGMDPLQAPFKAFEQENGFEMTDGAQAIAGPSYSGAGGAAAAPMGEGEMYDVLHRLLGEIVNGEVFRCIELLSLKEQDKVADLVRSLLRAQLERSREKHCSPALLAESLSRAGVGAVDAELLGRFTRMGLGGSAASSPVLAPAPSPCAGGGKKKRKMLPLLLDDEEGHFLQLVENGNTAEAVETLQQSNNRGHLLQCGNNGGITALHHACFGGYEDLARVLLGMGADPNRKTDYGFTALMAAVQGGDVGLLRAVLESRANVNERDHFEQRSALHLAVSRGDFEACKALLDFRADASLRDRKDKRPADKAREAGNEELARFLELPAGDAGFPA